ncbi:hypothetical protein GMD78_20840 [Ornithinibacillus sp. L9]|uniref:Uncharacterized protein n=1 Tax=Ornithinibacillus caprae TaxID=2678566 RepID=A0A6N8FMI5_9BACI|nr:DUF6470 family protein [Ornithinibacillus caprae]MUK90802.1 hypothetical protein [Ornithinibacillus caprae]
MQLPQIRLQSQMAKIEITQQPAKQEISQPKADLSIQQPSADISMRKTPSKLTIDQTQAWEDMDLMHIFRRNEKFAQDGKQGNLDGIGRRAEQGKELMEIEKGGNPIVSQAITNGHNAMKSLGIKFVPSTFAVKIDYQPSELEIDVTVNKPIIEAQANKPEHYFEPGTVNTSMKQFPNLDIDFVNLFTE